MSKRILIAGFKHETHTFSRLPTDLTSYRDRILYRRAEVPARLAGTRSEVAAFLDAATRHGWQVVTPVVADATPSGKVTEETYRVIAGEILDAAANEGPFDGVLLNLHGAMVAEHTDDGEGTLLAALREVLGPGVPIAATLDLHANVTDRMAECADILVSYRTYPHIDQYEVAAEAAALMARTLAGEIRPQTLVARGRMLDGVDHGRTSAPGPMLEVQAAAARLQAANPGILSFSINAGFPSADIRDCGPSVVIVGDGDDPSYAAAARALVDEIWERRHRHTVTSIGSREAIARLRERRSGAKPTVLADFADNPGGGGYGDATGLLAALIAADLPHTVFATVYDPAAAALCHAAGEGAQVQLLLGGAIDPAYGPPLAVSGRVQRLTDGRFALDGPMSKGVAVDMGPSAVLQVGNVAVVIANRRFQALDTQFFRHAGIEPSKQEVVAVKSAQHFRAAFAPLASEVLVVDDGGGLTSDNYRRFEYHNVRRPIYPLDLE